MPSDISSCADVCPQCRVPFNTGRSRPLREECGHTRCYSCTFSTAHCPMCPLVRNDGDSPRVGGWRSPGRSPLRSTSASPCRARTSALQGPGISRGPSPSPSAHSPRPAPYYHHQLYGSRAAPRPGRRRSRRVSVPLPLPRKEVPSPSSEMSAGLYGYSPDQRPHTIMSSSTGGPEAENEDLYSRFQLLLASPPHPQSSGGSRASSGRPPHSANSSPFSTLTGSSELEPCGRQEDVSMYGERFYCPPVYASPRMGAAVIGKPPLPIGRANPSLQSRALPPRPPSAKGAQPTPDTEFFGRGWLYEELSKVLSCEATENRGAAITGAIGTGKTAAIIKILDEIDSNQGSSASEIYTEPLSSLQTEICGIASRVVAYHFCLAGDASTSLIPDFVHSLANQLYQSPALSAYKELVQSDGQLQNILSLSSCIRNPSSALEKGVFQPLQKLRRRGKLPGGAIVILLDGLSESEKEVTSISDSLASFILSEIKNAPNILKIVITLRSNGLIEKTSAPLRQISLNLHQNSFNELVQQDLLQYVTYRCEHSQRIRDNISVTPDALDSGSVLDRFAHHIVHLSKGSILYLKLIINLIENGLLVLKSGSFKILPQSLSEIFLLMFNLKFPTTTNFEKHQPIFNVVLASPAPLTLLEIYQSINAGLLCQFPSWTEFLYYFRAFKDLLRKRQDNTLVFFHPALREWLVHRSKGESQKFLCDVSCGHSFLALKLSRLDWPLDEIKTLQLAHHIVRSSTFGDCDPRHEISQSDCQALWITQSSQNPSAALSHPRNIFRPDIQISKLLLRAGASPNQTINVMKNSSILGLAAHFGFVEFAQLLLEFEADPNKINSDGDTPLMVGASAGHVHIVQMLIKYGANITARNGLEETALVKAACCGHDELVRFFLACKWSQLMLRKEAQQALVIAARNGHAQTMDQLIQFKEELVNGQDNHTGDTALAAAAKAGQVEAIKCLIQWSVSKSRKTRKGESALCCAVKNGHYEACKLLLDYGSSVDDRNDDGQTALIIAATEGHFGLMELLTARGARLCSVDAEGLTALSWACLLGRRHAVQYLMDQGADVNHADHCGRTPLDLAAHQGSGPVIKLLMERGAMVEHVDLSGMRPLDRAISAGNVEAVECFLQKGAKLGPTTWTLASSQPRIVLILLCKLKEDGMALCRKNRLKDAAHRFSYALRKIPTDVENEELQNTLLTMRLHLTLNLSRTKRKMNELEEAIQLANEALQLSKDSYESYYARAQANRKGGKLEDALDDVDQALSLIPEICVSGNIHRCLTDVREEIITDLKITKKGCASSPTDNEKHSKKGGDRIEIGSSDKAGSSNDHIMTSSILSESGYSSNF